MDKKNIEITIVKSDFFKLVSLDGSFFDDAEEKDRIKNAIEGLVSPTIVMVGRNVDIKTNLIDLTKPELPTA